MKNTLNNKINSYLNHVLKFEPGTYEIFIDLLNNLYFNRLMYWRTKSLIYVNSAEKSTLEEIRELNINPIMREIIIKDTYKGAYVEFLESN